MSTEWPPQKKLPPGFPLASVDEAGRPIAVGAMVRIVSVASSSQGLPPAEQGRLRSYEGKTFPVHEIDRYGMVWFQPADGGAFSLKPRDLAVA